MAKTSKQPVKKFQHWNGKKGRCLICNTEKHTVVNGICFDCSTKDKPHGERE